MNASVYPLTVGDGRFQIGPRIGTGSFGFIQMGTDLTTKLPVAIKLEDKSRHRYDDNRSHLQVERAVYTAMAGGVGVPKLFWHGSQGDYNVMVMDLLGPSLEDLFNFCNRKFSLKTILLLADQMIARVEFMHMKKYIHRDIKPSNFVMGQGEKGNIVYLIDFGLARSFVQGNKHIPYDLGVSFAGNALFASMNIHLEIQQCRRDDLEAIGYIIMYFLRGNLPWQNMCHKRMKKKQKYDTIMEKKLTEPLEEMCKGLPNELIMYLAYCRELYFEEMPNYRYLRSIFRTLYRSEGLQYTYIFDWQR